ncbi:MAG TPA: glycosyltransferase family 4 protein [Phycisphaerae bacterium]|nr:glycosyltransferase family 4 protein [Phycisphaerae bacterium]
MRIAFFTHQFPGIRMGGLGSYTVAAARALADAGHDVHIFTFPLPDDVQRQFAEDSGHKITLHAVPDLATRVAGGAVSAELAAAVQAGGEAIYRLAMGALLSDALLADHAAKPFDVVEAPECEGLTVPLMLSLRQAGAHEAKPLAIVTQIHSGAAISRDGNQQERTPADLAIDALEAAAISLADGVVAMTQFVVRETRRTLDMTRDVELIPLAVPLEKDFPPPPADGPVLFVGRLERLKGVDTIVRAAAQFLNSSPGAKLRFVGPDTPTAPKTGDSGETSMRAWMLRQIPEELQSRVEFTGELPPREVTAQIRQSRFLVLPSVVENFSLVAAQGIGMGRTCVFSSDIGTVEIYGETGVAFPKGDAGMLATAMSALWNDAARIERLSRGAWERAHQLFNQTSVTAKQISFYERAIAAAAQGRPDLSTIPPLFATALIEPLVAMTRFACGINNAVLTPGQRLLAIMEQIARQQGTPHARVLLYGAGRHSTRLLTEKHLWTKAGHEVVGFIDDGARWANGGTHLGLPVMSKQVLLAGNDAAPIPSIVLSTDTFEDQFWQQTQIFRERGVDVFRLYAS